MKRILTLTLLLLFLCPTLRSASPHNFYAHFGFESGLSDSHIRNCCQDSYGRLWLATSGGVYFYNGSGFSPFSNSVYNERCSKMTFAVAEDTCGRIWIASGTEAGYYDPASESFTVLSDIEGPVRDIDVDRTGNIWLTCQSGIWLVKPLGAKAEKIVSNDRTQPNTSTILNDEGCMLVISSAGSIYRFDIGTREFSLLIDSKLTGATYNAIADSGNGTILVSTDYGEVQSIDIHTGDTSLIYRNTSLDEAISTTCLLVNGDEYWIGTSLGAVIVNHATGETDDQTSLSTRPLSIAGNTVRCFMKDNKGNVWAGTLNSGLFCWENFGDSFRRMTANSLEFPLSGKSIRSICEDRPGSLWLGSEEGRLEHFDTVSNTIEDYTSDLGLRYGTIITSITYWRSMLWIMTYGDGFFQFDPRAGKVVKKYTGPTNRYFCTLPESETSILLGTGSGVYRFNAASEQFTFIDIIGKCSIISMARDKHGRILAGTYGHGLGIWDKANEQTSVLTVQDSQHGLRSNDINYIYPDSEGNIWVCSEGSGIERIRIDDNGDISEADYLNQRNRMPSNNVTCMVESCNNGKLWASTTNGLVEIDPKEFAVRRVYLQADNVIGSHFIGGSGLMASNDLIYMGTSRGLFSYDPERMQDLFDDKIMITEVAYRSLKGRGFMNTKSVLLSESIRLKRKDTDQLSVSFSTMTYANPNVQLYDCLLTKRGFSESLATGFGSMTYYDLKPGKYNFQVSARGTGQSDAITIVITPPWYASLLAKLIYALMILGAIALIIRYLLRERKKEEEIEAANKQMQTLHERMDFVTNITHEIRTPVTMMSMLMDRMPEGNDAVTVPKDDLKSLKMNMNRLLDLCNQILDFRKMENEQLHLMMTDLDICRLTREISDSFVAVTQSQGIAFTISVPDTPVLVRGDRKSIEGILMNLLSNAVKFCNHTIGIELTGTDSEVTVRVNNDGEKVPEKDSELIFNAFYQVRKTGGYGTGLGLTYSRSLANMNNGRLYYDNKVTDLNSFIFRMPVLKSGMSVTFTDEPQTVGDDTTDNEEAVLSGRPVILVVEDNSDLKRMISEELSKEYDTLMASNGAEALEVVRANRVDMVVSDIMMPVMDGCQLCNAIKSDVDLSHILVVLLTAAIGVDNHIRSLKAGADSYIEKPFKLDLLKANIHSLFKNIEIRNEQFAKSPLAQYMSPTGSTVEQDFMNKLHDYIVENISETEMSTERLADAMNVSKKTLINKIKANTGLSVNEYVRASRLKKAAEILAKKKYRINEVAYLVGYSTPSYFTKHFQKQFGMKPSDFVHSLR